MQIKHRWTGAVLFESKHRTIKATVTAAMEARADLSEAYLSEAYLGGANLGGANLGGAYLGGAYLRGADLGGADLGGAYLGGANLGGANLGRADLGRADLGGAYLGGANLGRADLGGVHDVIPLGQPNGWWAFAWHRDGVIQVRVGCRSMTLAKGRDYWADKADRREVLAALDYAEAVAKLREWPITAAQADAA